MTGTLLAHAPWEQIVSSVPNGSVLCAAPHVEGVRTSPEAVEFPYRPGPYQDAPPVVASASLAMPGAAASRHASIRAAVSNSSLRIGNPLRVACTRALLYTPEGGMQTCDQLPTCQRSWSCAT